MTDKQALFDELAPCLDRPRRGRDGRLWAFCPCHPDGAKHQGQADRGLAGRSLYLHPRIGLGCFAGCAFEAISAALRNGSPRPPSPPQIGRDQLVALYDYLKLDGSPGGQKGRFEGPDGKRFAWRLPGATEWKGGVKLDELSLYGVEGLAEEPDKTVYVVEGEKCMESCVEHGLLAVTHGGGSSATIPEQALEPLRDRNVRLWPDNDAVGRAAMTRIAAQLRGIAKSIGWVTPPIALPEKGDAFDYFAKGGTVEALEKSQPPTEPVVEVLSYDSIRVVIPTVGGLATFTFEELEASSHRLEAQIEIAYGPGEPYRERRNLLSGSQRTELRRSLDEFYDKAPGWERLLNTAYNRARTTWAAIDRSITLPEIPLSTDAEQFALFPLLPRGAATILFGDGSAGKTYIAERIALSFATGLPFAGMESPKATVLFVDYEDTRKKFRWRMERLALGMGLEVPRSIRYWPGDGIPFTQQATRIRRLVEEWAIGLVIIDSAAIACGDEPEKAVVAAGFFRALATLQTTSLVLAHITKPTDQDKRFGKKDVSTLKPFGSAFWHNLARRTWWVNREQPEESPTMEIALVCRKVNDGPWPRAIPLLLTFDDPAGAVRVDNGDFEPASELAKGSLTLNSRIKLALGRGTLEVKEIMEGLGLKDTKANYDTVYMSLDRGSRATARRPALFIHKGNTWGLATQEY